MAACSARAGGRPHLSVLATPLFFVNRNLIFDRTATLLLPAIYQWPDMAEEGGLAGYGPRFTQVIRQWARLVAKNLRGAKPADLPVEQPTKFELVINLRTAKTLGLNVPETLLATADVVIK